MDTPKSAVACCPTYRIMEMLSKKWSMLILRAMTDSRKMRFSEILDALPDLSSRILSERLTELEGEDLIRRKVLQTKPIIVTYEITDKGMGLKNVFDTFIQWEKKWRGK